MGAFLLSRKCGTGMGSGREIHISGQKNYTYEKTNIPVVMVDEEKEKPLKIGYVTLYAKFFMDAEYSSQK